jgi:hypothetical protein
MWGRATALIIKKLYAIFTKLYTFALLLRVQANSKR